MRAAFGAASVVALALVLAACAGGDGDVSGTVAVTMGSPEEYSLVPVPAEIPAGAIRFDVVNEGELEHEMVVIKTDLGAANLATDDGEADEAGAMEEIELDAGDSGD